MKSDHGITDGPPSTMSAHQLASAWLSAESPWEWTAPDGSHIHRYCLIDFDYEMAYLLSVRSPESGTVDLLAVLVRHGEHPVKGWNLTTEWWHHSTTAEQRAWASQGHLWFVAWAMPRFN